jgi:hypothetical protein
MTVYVEEARAHVRRLVLVVEVVPVLQEYATEEQLSLVHLLWAKGLSTKNIHKEMFPVYGRKCLLHKSVHSWVADVLLMTKRLKWRC